MNNVTLYIQSWDCGYESHDGSSYSVCQTWGVADNGFYLVDQFRDRLEYPNLMRTVMHLAECHSPDLILIEYQASGRSLVQDLYNNTRLHIKAIKTSRESKILRAQLATPIVETGKVYLPAGAEWIDDFLYELTLFPASAHSDQVDALTQAILFLKDRFKDPNKVSSVRRRLSTADRPPVSEDSPLTPRERLRLLSGPRVNLSWRLLKRPPGY